MQAKRLLLVKKREDKMGTVPEQRVPANNHDKLAPTDFVVLLNLVFGPSHRDVEAKKRTIAETGVVPFTKCLLQHPEIVRGSVSASTARR